MPDNYDENLILGYIEGDLSPQDARAFAETLRQDPALRRLVTQMSQDRAALRDLPEVEPPAGIMERVSEHLERSMLLDSRGNEPPASRPIHTNRLGRIVMGIAIAAMLVFAATVVVPIFIETFNVANTTTAPLVVDEAPDASKMAMDQRGVQSFDFENEAEALARDQRIAKADGDGRHAMPSASLGVPGTPGVQGEPGAGRVAMKGGSEAGRYANDLGAVASIDSRDADAGRVGKTGQTATAMNYRSNVSGQRMKIQVIAADAEAAQSDVLRWAMANGVSLAKPSGSDVALAMGDTLAPSRGAGGGGGRAGELEGTSSVERRPRSTTSTKFGGEAAVETGSAAKIEAGAAAGTAAETAAKEAAPPVAREYNGKSVRAATPSSPAGQAAPSQNANQPGAPAATTPSPQDDTAQVEAQEPNRGGQLAQGALDSPVDAARPQPESQVDGTLVNQAASPQVTHGPQQSQAVERSIEANQRRQTDQSKQTEQSTQTNQFVFNLRAEQVPELVGYLNRDAAPSSQVAVVEPNAQITETLVRDIAQRSRAGTSSLPSVAPAPPVAAATAEPPATGVPAVVPPGTDSDVGAKDDAADAPLQSVPQSVPAPAAVAQAEDAKTDDAKTKEDLAKRVDELSRELEEKNRRALTISDEQQKSPAPASAPSSQMIQSAILTEGQFEVEVEIVTAE